MKNSVFIWLFSAFAVFAMWTISACTESVLPVETSEDSGVILSETALGEEPRDDVSEERATGLTGQKAGQNQSEVGGNFNCKNRYKYYSYLLSNDTMIYTYPKSKPTIKRIETDYNFYGDDLFLNIPFVSDTTGTEKKVKFVLGWNGKGASPVAALAVTFKFKDDSQTSKKINVVPSLPPNNESGHVLFGTQKYHLIRDDSVTLERFNAIGEAITPTWIPKAGQLIIFGEFKKGLITQSTIGTVAPNVGLWHIKFDEYNAKCSALKTKKEYIISPSFFKTMKSADGVSLATKFVN